MTRDLGVTKKSPVSPMASGASYLRGVVDYVNPAVGVAVVSGMVVDYSDLLSNSSAPRVGDEIGVVGRSYGSLGLLVADPLLRLE